MYNVGFAHKLAVGFVNEDYVKTILRSYDGTGSRMSMEYVAISTETRWGGYSPEWVRFGNDNLLIVKEISGRYARQVQQSRKEVFYLPTLLARAIKKHQPDTQILGMNSAVGSVSFCDVEATAKMQFLLKQVLASLSEMRYDAPYEVSIVQFDNEKTLGKADIDKKHIYLADHLFDRGRREIALTIMEETEHIKSKYDDETREFENHVLSGWLAAIENANGLFL